MMKRFLMILVMVSWCSVGYAGKGHVGLRSGEENKTFNELITNFNKYLDASSFESIDDYCDSITPMNLRYFIEMANCWYEEEIRLLKQYDLWYENLNDILHTTYKRLFNASRELQTLIARRGFRQKDVDSFEEARKNLMLSWYKRSKDEYKKFSTNLNNMVNSGKE